MTTVIHTRCQHILVPVAGLLLAAAALVHCTDNVCPENRDGDPSTSCDRPARANEGGATDSSSSGGGGGGGVDDHSCWTPHDCSEGFFCYFAGSHGPDSDHRYCGGEGVCTPVPETCDDTYAPICTCGGVAADNRCKGQQAGFDLQIRASRCRSPRGTFTCGHTYCTRGIEYCELHKETGFPTGGHCLPLPSACETVDGCACVEADACAPPFRVELVQRQPGHGAHRQLFRALNMQPWLPPTR